MDIRDNMQQGGDKGENSEEILKNQNIINIVPESTSKGEE